MKRPLKWIAWRQQIVAWLAVNQTHILEVLGPQECIMIARRRQVSSRPVYQLACVNSLPFTDKQYWVMIGQLRKCLHSLKTTSNQMRNFFCLDVNKLVAPINREKSIVLNDILPLLLLLFLLLLLSLLFPYSLQNFEKLFFLFVFLTFSVRSPIFDPLVMIFRSTNSWLGLTKYNTLKLSTQTSTIHFS